MNFDDYDIVHIGVSGGKDSTAALLWLVHESGIPHDKIRASFSDTGNEDMATYDQVAMLSRDVFPIETIKPPLDFWELARHKKRFPAPKVRFCTVDLKLKPAQAHILQWQKQGMKVLLITGVRRAESPARSKLKKFDWDEYFAADVYRPLIDWTLSDVYIMHHEHSIPPNPLYRMGAERVGCFPCIMSRKAEIRMIARRRPEKIDFIRKQELIVAEFSSFFAKKTTPPRFRSKQITRKDGEIDYVPTIDDVVAWSKTAWGGKQFEMDFEPQCQMGVCE